MRKLILLFTFIISLLSLSFSQTGKLDIYIEYPNSLSTELWFNDSLLTSKDIDWYETLTFDSLKEGIYVFKIFDQDGWGADYKGIKVYNDSLTYLEISPYYFDISCQECFSCDSVEDIAINYNLLVNPPPLNPKIYGKGVSVKISINHLTKPWSNFQFGGGFGLYYDYFFIDSLFALNPDFLGKKQHYTNTGFEFILLTRTTTYSVYNPNAKGLFLEIGASYKLPLNFRHIATIKNNRISTKKLHKYNDVHALIKLGYKHNDITYSLLTDYKFFNTIKKEYPQLPIWAVGISVSSSF